MTYDYHIIFGALGVLLGLVAYGLYFRSIFRGETKPHIFTWLTFTLIDGTVFFAQILHGAGPGSWILLLSVVENTIVVVLATRWGEKHITRSDWVSFFGALFGILLWWLTDNALAAVVVASIINILAVVPTLRKSYLRPDQESVTLWSIDLLRFSLSMAALVSFNLTTALFPAVIILANASVVALVLLRRRQLAKR